MMPSRRASRNAERRAATQGHVPPVKEDLVGSVRAAQGLLSPVEEGLGCRARGARSSLTGGRSPCVPHERRKVLSHRWKKTLGVVRAAQGLLSPVEEDLASRRAAQGLLSPAEQDLVSLVRGAKSSLSGGTRP